MMQICFDVYGGEVVMMALVIDVGITWVPDSTIVKLSALLRHEY